MAETDKFLYTTVKVINEPGLHARPAGSLVQKVSRFSCDVFVEKDGHRVNAKSIMGVLTLEAAKGCSLTFYASGTDASEALKTIEEFFKKKWEGA